MKQQLMILSRILTSKWYNPEYNEESIRGHEEIDKNKESNNFKPVKPHIFHYFFK